MDAAPTIRRWEPWAIGASIVVFAPISVWLFVVESRPVLSASITIPNTLLLVLGIVITLRTGRNRP